MHGRSTLNPNLRIWAFRSVSLVSSLVTSLALLVKLGSFSARVSFARVFLTRLNLVLLNTVWCTPSMNCTDPMPLVNFCPPLDACLPTVLRSGATLVPLRILSSTVTRRLSAQVVLRPQLLVVSSFRLNLLVLMKMNARVFLTSRLHLLSRTAFAPRQTALMTKLSWILLCRVSQVRLPQRLSRHVCRRVSVSLSRLTVSP
mmetsp:Transcript_1050/g.2559  ORF Transcript_1050/g.2559 Transcript_1050/m.2559 type:complete len:201 (+) Transcript_1050:2038-2640(+)